MTLIELLFFLMPVFLSGILWKIIFDTWEYWAQRRRLFSASARGTCFGRF
jgi:hypothetical protein